MDAPTIHTDGGAAHRIAFGCNPAESRAASRALRAFLAEHLLDEAELFACELCLAEACNNAVQYADERFRNEPIVAEAVCTSSQVELRVTDHTQGFDFPKNPSVPPPDSERGRGIFIIHSMMDGVRYLRSENHNTLVMWKRRSHHLHRPSNQPSSESPDDLRRQLEDFKRTIGAMARELCFRSESLAAIFRCGTELGRAGDLEGFAQRLLGDLLHLTSTDWFVLRLIPPRDLQLTVFAASDPELMGEPLRLGTTNPSPASAELAAAATRTAVPYTARHARLPSEPLRAAGPRAGGLVHPVLFGETLVGTLAVGRRENAGPFSELQAEVIRTFAEFLAIQIVNLRHQEEQIGARLITRELEIARSIQKASFPRSLPQLGNFSLAGRWESARQVAGDFYDAMPLGDHSLLLVVADVMGKGVPAAMFATITRALIRAMAPHHHQPADLLMRLNALLYEELSAVDMFITIQLVCIDLQWRHVVAASAGHCPVLLVSGDGNPVRTLGPTGTPLGIQPDPIYDQECATLPDPACLMIYTDGLTEAFNPAGEMFGRNRLGEWLRERVRFPCAAEQLCEGLASELDRFREGTPLRDDQTFLILADKCPTSVAHPQHPSLAGWHSSTESPSVTHNETVSPLTK
ncbi:MAG: uncharacterized protein K0R17_670 [Rariglobus sp.]|jgi:serine phosphatase RsbU (regulator of sigma subunit)/anti-sigma regulatory factor (Ser/Thr protein kinase)|nr:uncharacterized protein [Rariglobus sp.]